MVAQHRSVPHLLHRGLSVELFGLLCAKAVMLGLLYFIFFSPAHGVATDATSVSAHVYGGVLH
jgi:hypothetical protein